MLVEFLGVLAFAFTGIIEARKKNMDIVGVYVVCMVAAFGGGTVRDLLIGHFPLFWIAHSGYAMLLLVLVIVTAPVPTSVFELAGVNRIFQWLDALGLGLFCAVGASLAHQSGHDFFICILFGVMTAVFGGIFRDILCNQIPNVFRRNELYATCSAVGSAVLLAALYLGCDMVLATIFSIVFTASLRLLAVKRQIRLPF